MTPTPQEQARRLADEAQKALAEACRTGYIHMTVPVDEERDTDRIIGRAIRHLRELSTHPAHPAAPSSAEATEDRPDAEGVTADVQKWLVYLREPPVKQYHAEIADTIESLQRQVAYWTERANYLDNEAIPEFQRDTLKWKTRAEAAEPKPAELAAALGTEGVIARKVAWLRGLAEKGGKGTIDNIDARCLGRIADDIESLQRQVAELQQDVADERETKEYEARRHDFWKAKVAELSAAGGQMANVLFNLKQLLIEYKVKQRYIDSMDATQRAWDAALTATPTASPDAPVRRVIDAARQVAIMTRADTYNADAYDELCNAVADYDASIATASPDAGEEKPDWSGMTTRGISAEEWARQAPPSGSGRAGGGEDTK